MIPAIAMSPVPPQTRRARLSLLVALIVVMAAGCGDDKDARSDDSGGEGTTDGAEPEPDDGEPQPDPGEPQPDPGEDPAMGTGKIRIVHTAPTDGPLDIYLEGSPEPLFAGVAYGTATEPATVAEGAYRLEVRVAGESPETMPLYTSDPIEVPADGAVTALAGGRLASPVPATAFRITSVTDGFEAAAPATARVRMINQSYAAALMAIDFASDGTPEIASLERFTASDAAGLELPAGRDLELSLLRPSPAATFGTFAIPASALGDGEQVYAVLTGLPTIRARDPRSFQILLVRADRPTVAVRLNPMLYLLAASPDASALDGFIGTGKAFDNAGFGTLRLARVRPSVTGYTMDFHLHTADPTPPPTAPLASLSTGPLEAGQQYLVVLNGLVAGGADPLALHVFRDELQLEGDGRIRSVHAALGVPEIDVGRIESGLWHDIPEFAGLATGAASPAAGTQIVENVAQKEVNPAVRATSEPAIELRLGGVGQLLANDRWYGVVAGAWAPTTGQQGLRYFLVGTAAIDWTVEIRSPIP